jgi:hypothetical protein
VFLLGSELVSEAFMTDTNKPEAVPPHPECETCQFFRRRSEVEAACNRHHFVIPRVEWPTLCRDWQQGTQRLTHPEMRAKALYYYTVSSGQWTQLELAPFSRLRNALFSVLLRFDEEMGWVIVPRQNQMFFPAANSEVTVMASQRPCKFQILHAERRIAAEMIPLKGGQWQRQYHMQQVFMLASLESSNLLYDWMNTYMDVEACLRNRFAPSLFAFMEVQTPNQTYTLYPDVLAYQDFLR